MLALVGPDEPAGLAAARALTELDAEDRESGADGADAFVPEPLPEQRSVPAGPPRPRRGPDDEPAGDVTGPDDRPTGPHRTPSPQG